MTRRRRRARRARIPEDPRVEELRRLLRSGDIDPLLWLIHFPEAGDRRVPTCEECADFCVGACEGGRDPLECFQDSGKRIVELEFENWKGEVVKWEAKR